MAVIAVAALALATVVSAPPAAAETAPPFLFSWDASGASGIAINADGVVYVTDVENNRVQRFDSTGTLLGSWGSSGSGPGQFDEPAGIAVDSAGFVYVTDYGSDRIQKFTSTGGFVTQWGGPGTGPGQFDYPWGISTDTAGNVYVADYGNDRIQKFTSTGTFVTQWATPGDGTVSQPDHPRGLAVDSGGNVYVAVSGGNSRIQKFTSGGSLITSWSAVASGPATLRNPTAIAVGPTGSVFVVDLLNARVVKFNGSGGFLSTWGSFGDQNGQFMAPWGVAVDAEGGVYVSELDGRIQKFGTAVTRPDARVRRGANGNQAGDNIYNTNGTDQTATGSLQRGRKINYFITAQNDAAVADKLKIRGHSSNSAFLVRYYDANNTVITPQVVAGTYTTRRLNPGQSVDIRMEITLKTNAPPPACPLPCHELLTRPVTVSSKANPNQTDTIRTTTTRLN